ncbi:IAA-amino acid hydrolase ILR1-like [Asimina triloba]
MLRGQVIVGQAAVQRCNVTLNFQVKGLPFFPVTVNSKALHELFRHAASDMLGAENVREMNPLSGSEDFAFYADAVPGFYFFLGMQNESQRQLHSPHSPYFTVNEDVLPYGAALYASLATRYLLEFHRPSSPMEGDVHDEL